MAARDLSGKSTLSGRDRTLLGLLAAGLLALLAMAAWLEPDRRGHGTHQQLGLPPCTFWVLSGRPCPTCGMTTAWAHLIRGQWINAFRANAAGALLAAVALASAPWLLASAVCGRWLGWEPKSLAVAWAAVGLVIVLLIDWLWRLLTG